MNKQPLINGNRDSAEILDPPHYPAFVEAVKASHANSWQPQEVATGDDRSCYANRLTEPERAVFNIQFARLTWMDMNIPNPLFRLGQKSTAAEVTQWIIRQLAEEQIHQDTYQYCAEITGLDRSYLYTRHIENPEVQAMAAMAREFTAMLDSDIYKSVFFYSQVYEGMWFMGGFAPIFALGEKGLMKSTCDLLEYIWRDENNHVQGWTEWLKLLSYEYRRPDDAELVEIMVRGLELEFNYVRANFPPLVNYNVDTHMRWMRHLANLRMTRLGFDEACLFADAAPPLWISRWQTKKLKNFFETRVTEYQVGGALLWDDDEPEPLF